MLKYLTIIQILVQTLSSLLLSKVRQICTQGLTLYKPKYNHQLSSHTFNSIHNLQNNPPPSPLPYQLLFHDINFNESPCFSLTLCSFPFEYRHFPQHIKVLYLFPRLYILYIPLPSTFLNYLQQTSFTSRFRV